MAAKKKTLSISVTILVKNSETYIAECLHALQAFDEVIVLDNGSTDRTLEIAKTFENVKIHRHDFIGFGPLKNLAASFATHDWIFNVDSDEIVSEELILELQNCTLQQTHIYSIPRHNYYKKKWIKCCGWYPDRVLRIYNRNHTRYNDNMVHESLIKNENTSIELLSSPLVHHAYDSIEQLLEKLQRYSTLWAQNNTKKSSPSKAFGRALFAFFRNYFLQKGFLCGYEGLLISVTNANHVFYKYMKLYENQTFRED